MVAQLSLSSLRKRLCDKVIYNVLKEIFMNFKKIIGILIVILLVGFAGNTEAASGRKVPIVRVYDGGAYELNEKLKAGGFIPSDNKLDKGTRHPETL